MSVPPLTLVTAGDADAFAGLAARAESIESAARAVTGHDALGDAVWRDLRDPGDDSAAFLVDGTGFVHAMRHDLAGAHGWSVASTYAPTVPAAAIRLQLLGAAVDHIATHGGGRAELWVFGASDADDAALTAAGWSPSRALHEMRVPLPIAQTPTYADGVTVRTFTPGVDDDAFLAVNNRAFGDHPDQGHWDAATLQRRIDEAWFDPSLFFLAFDADGLAGFNWLKVHPAAGTDPALGEIYVIGTDPRTQGTGLGRALALTGLAAVHDRGINTGSLFVAADNEPALRLYRSLGFTVHRTDRAYVRDVEVAAS